MNLITIFTVDDYLLTRIAHKKYFSGREGFKIIGDFSTVCDCLEHLKLVQPDIVLMDIEMSDMDGVEATRIIKERYPKIKVIIFTSFESEDLVIPCLAAGACGYVVKNKTSTELSKIIRMVMEGAFFMDIQTAANVFSKIQPVSSDVLGKLEELSGVLTQRELEVLRLMSEGKTNPEIASEMIVSINTAKAHVGKILAKLSVNDRVQAVVKAIRANLL